MGQEQQDDRSRDTRQVHRILRDLLLDDSIELTMETRREDVPNWDSFNYINFIVAVEMNSG